MKPKNDRTIEWARIGAGMRLRELDIERAEILKRFPELRRAGVALAGSSAGLRKKLTPAARRKLSAGMRKYWARRKAEAARKG